MFQAVQIAYNREIKAHMFQARNQGDKDLKTGWVTKKSMVLIVFWQEGRPGLQSCQKSL